MSQPTNLIKRRTELPASGFEAPFEMLAACHERVERMLNLLQRLQQHLATAGRDEQARQAARDIMRYFDLAAPNHHQDEELHLFPLLAASPDAALRELGLLLSAQHRQMELLWHDLRQLLTNVAEAVDWSPLASEQLALIAAFDALYREHLDLENQQAYPATEACITPAALQAMSADMMQRRGA